MLPLKASVPFLLACLVFLLFENLYWFLIYLQPQKKEPFPRKHSHSPPIAVRSRVFSTSFCIKKKKKWPNGVCLPCSVPCSPYPLSCFSTIIRTTHAFWQALPFLSWCIQTLLFKTSSKNLLRKIHLTVLKKQIPLSLSTSLADGWHCVSRCTSETPQMLWSAVGKGIRTPLSACWTSLKDFTKPTLFYIILCSRHFLLSKESNG